MSKLCFSIVLTLVLLSCQDRPQGYLANQEGRLDSLDLSEDTQEDEKEAITPILQVDIYELDYDNQEFPGKNGFKRKSSVLSKRKLGYFDFLALRSIINDSSSYTTSGAACFYPNIGVVVYEEASTILSELYICMHCNNSELYDSNGTFTKVQRKDGKYGFSERVRNRIRSLIASYGFDTKYSYALFYDYPGDYLQHQIHNGRDSVEVVNDILEYYEYDKSRYPEKTEVASLFGWTERSPGFFDTENIGEVVYEYDDTGSDKFTCYLGEFNVNDTVFYVCNVFHRVQAAMVLHGHSSLLFLNSEQEIAAEYSMSIPGELPKAINQNQLEFNIDGNTYFVEEIDFLLPYLCIEEGEICVPKVE